MKQKNRTLKCLKMVLFDCAINEKCCSVDGGRWAQVELTDALGLGDKGN